MIRIALILALLCSPVAAQQTQCPGSPQSWSFTLPPPMQWALYDLLAPPGVPTGMLSILYLNRTAETFIGVPQAVAQSFQYSSNQQQFFNNQIKPVYHELLLYENTSCPFLLQKQVGTSYLATGPNRYLAVAPNTYLILGGQQVIPYGALWTR